MWHSIRKQTWIWNLQCQESLLRTERGGLCRVTQLQDSSGVCVLRYRSHRASRGPLDRNRNFSDRNPQLAFITGRSSWGNKIYVFFQMTIKNFLGFSAALTVICNPLQLTEIWRRKLYFFFFRKSCKDLSISASEALFKMKKKRL